MRSRLCDRVVNRADLFDRDTRPCSDFSVVQMLAEDSTIHRLFKKWGNEEPPFVRYGLGTLNAKYGLDQLKLQELSRMLDCTSSPSSPLPLDLDDRLPAIMGLLKTHRADLFDTPAVAPGAGWSSATGSPFSLVRPENQFARVLAALKCTKSARALLARGANGCELSADSARLIMSKMGLESSRAAENRDADIIHRLQSNAQLQDELRDILKNGVKNSRRDNLF